ncbi:NAD(P)H-dependent oxidoreductase [Microvirga sp. ACRRW]|uniref:NADPH-dependent FMN reductase n=1 Tax=Microvirga sp. ACRRW TaxID=2918205 RepID=UPI001EF5C8D4|nr:NADPH-dependent FMN reductase [Microvirga sp. ACRRW]MCG7394276.1 NAD(P)H-dependent oxidoreductase [Microvirga sp. ACRRW]
MHLLALSGSLRAGSFNTSALRALQKLAPGGVAVEFYEGIGALPHFNPDVEMSALPESVADLRWQVAAADGVVIACPEYAHGIPGAFKNALDWLVGCENFPGKPVMLINTAPRASHAQAQLAEILKTMSARMVPEAGVTVDLREADAMSTLQAGLAAFVDACRQAAGMALG